MNGSIRPGVFKTGQGVAWEELCLKLPQIRNQTAIKPTENFWLLCRAE
jgi:hypothetical protein